MDVDLSHIRVVDGFLEIKVYETCIHQPPQHSDCVDKLNNKFRVKIECIE